MCAMPPLAMKKARLADLTPYPGNPRRGNVAAIAESLESNGQYRPIVVQKSTNVILAGNHTAEAAESLGWTTIHAVFVDVDDEQAKTIMLADNRTSDLAEYDETLLAELLNDMSALGGTGYSADDLAEIEAELEAALAVEDEAALQGYTTKIEPPVYEITGDNPPIDELSDRTKTDELLAEIDAANLPPDVAEFLRQAAERHTKFNFRNVAEYYAHADAETQNLMERSALVIIDFDKAIENGYVTLTDRITRQYGTDYA